MAGADTDGIIKVSLGVFPVTLAAAERAAELEGGTVQDTINRAAQLYEAIIGSHARGGGHTIDFAAGDGSTVRLVVRSRRRRWWSRRAA